ncbi:hypothetical protein OESDEN_16481 [Oesophagostomum dentatum]|uniref:Uncharacterized protein n=1 Tax=Oesophagostomum dentatum TaxID=61180 RepID=A0A0B1SKS3_OESDE|nr:hypothetical protein OESDEN_16481 [Oesophagostomum dentatum]
MALAVVYASTVIGIVIFQLALHLVSVAYVCRHRCPSKPVDLTVDYRFDTSSVDSPTSAVLAMLKYQDETERTAVTMDIPSVGLTRTAENSVRNCSVPPLDLSSLNNNRPLSKQLVTPSPSKTNPVESPPYARLRTPTAFQFANRSFSDADGSPLKSFDFHRPVSMDYNRTSSNDRPKVFQSAAVGRLPSTSINEEYSIPELEVVVTSS